MVEFLVGSANQHRQVIDIDRARGVGSLCDLLGDQAVHHGYVSTSAKVVTVIV
jgi:hypothetical protein